MNKVTHVISGFSGTMKSTISKLMFPNIPYVDSPTKYSRDFNDRLCESCLDVNPIHNLMVRMFQMKLLIDQKELLVERSIYDFLFFAELFKIPDFTHWSESELRAIKEEWDKLAGFSDHYLIINKAPKFTEKYVIGSDKSRNDVYENRDEYWVRQNMYIDYYNKHINMYRWFVLTDDIVFRIINNEKVNIFWEQNR